MLQEVELDIANGNLYMSKRFNNVGTANYPDLLREASQSQNEIWLAGELRCQECMKTHKVTTRGTSAVPVTAADTFAEGKFNRFYIRGVCARALDEGIEEVFVYRAKAVSEPRPESQMLIGKKKSAKAVLNDLRNSLGVETALGLSRPNSGLSVRLP